ncbi:primosomal protein N' [Candidatus Gracilibacteria bacterium]|nr:primosomal protein N' [Candidatus Gracilibacteria bacterium]MCF7819744.1 primosomal protein N' [Candidatus Gracilibacteria bacterium]
MQFCDVWIRGVKGIFSWHFEKDQKISIGSRVVVRFRGKKRVGIVVSVTEKIPDFQTQPVQEIWEEHFIDERYIRLARNIAEENFTSFEKVLGLMIPDKFFFARHPEKRDIFYLLQSLNSSEFELKGEKQRLAVQILREEGGKAEEAVLRKKVSRATIQSLIKKGWIQEESGKIKNIFSRVPRGKPSFQLNSAQENAVEQIQSTDKPTLLFGVTGSGKTEVYKKLASKMLEQDQSAQVLFLLPEIALTPQLIDEFHSIFADKIAVWHSQLSEGEKIQEWARIQSGEARILIGARSAVLIPLRNPKLIILDEEHEWTFKNEFAPRFWTHDVVLKIEQIFCSKLVFGTATPRVESFIQVESGHWQRVNLSDRVHQVQLPEIQMVDLRNEAKKGNFGPLSEILIEELHSIFSQKKQAMLFLNKRGFSGATLCRVCGHRFECPHCSHCMKMHQRAGNQKFLCHVCGHMERFPLSCPECGSDHFVFRGWGTQMVEEILREKFPDIRLFRADSDSVSGKNDFEKLMDRFHEGEADVLLGTQMIAKGLDFENVQLVGVILADVGLNLPDFRSEERVFQILTQVAGRAGRRKKRGRIVIQTFRPEEKVFDFVRSHDSQGFLEWQQEIRRKISLPPFSALGKLTISHTQKETAFEEAKKIYHSLHQKLQQTEKYSSWHCHFAPAFFPRTHGKYHFHVFLKTPDTGSLVQFLRDHSSLVGAATIDINPSSLL